MSDDVHTKDSATKTEPTAAPVARAKPTTKAKRQVARGNVYIRASYNNTIVTVTDPQGDVLAWASAGSCGFRGPRKATPYAASVIIRELMKKLDGTGFREASVFVCGVGSGREAAVRALNANNVYILGLKDVTPIPHNGCRPPKPRRI